MPVSDETFELAIATWQQSFDEMMQAWEERFAVWQVQVDEADKARETASKKLASEWHDELASAQDRATMLEKQLSEAKSQLARARSWAALWCVIAALTILTLLRVPLSSAGWWPV